MRKDGEGDALTWDRCPKQAADVVKSNHSEGQETNCWIPKKLPIDNSVWQQCINAECVDLFPPKSQHKAALSNLWTHMEVAVVALLAAIFLLWATFCASEMTDAERQRYEDLKFIHKLERKAAFWDGQVYKYGALSAEL